MHITPELPVELEAELIALFKRETQLVLLRTGASDIKGFKRKHKKPDWIPRFKLVREKQSEQKDPFGPAYELVNYVEIVFSTDGRLDETLAARLPDELWKIVVIVAENSVFSRNKETGSRIRSARYPHLKFPGGIHLSKALSERSEWGISQTVCEMLESLFDRYRPP